MKQHELEAFVGRLAEAEQKAAAAIRQAENDMQHHLLQLEQELKQAEEEAMQRLEQELAAEAVRLDGELETRKQALDKATEKQIASMQARHEQCRETLVDWAVARITGR
jgi:oligoendopeptidase F